MDWSIFFLLSFFLLFFGLIIWYFIYSLRTAFYQGIRPTDRTEKDLKNFRQQILNLGYDENFFDSTIKVTRLLTYKDLIPKIDDDFAEDYLWNKIRGDQFETKVMECAGLILSDLMSGKLTDTNWKKYEAQYGRINNFESLLYYVYLRFEEGPKYLIKPNKLVW
ncbi:MAG: hypothetical protein AB8B61_01940 [Cyclobacteriaceae bacterium]